MKSPTRWFARAGLRSIGIGDISGKTYRCNSRSQAGHRAACLTRHARGIRWRAYGLATSLPPDYNAARRGAAGGFARGVAMAKRTVSRAIVEILVAAGVRRVYGVAGDSLNGI